MPLLVYPIVVPLIAGLIVEEITIANLSLWLAVGCASVAGHVFPVFLKCQNIVKMSFKDLLIFNKLKSY